MSSVKYGSPPRQTRSQQLDALAVANDVRSRRARFKRQIADGAPIDGLIREPPYWLARMKVEQLLLAIPKVGVVKARRVMVACKISPAKTVGGLSDRQRSVLLVAVAVIRPQPVADGETGGNTRPDGSSPSEATRGRSNSDPAGDP